MRRSQLLDSLRDLPDKEYADKVRRVGYVITFDARGRLLTIRDAQPQEEAQAKEKTARQANARQAVL